MNITYYPLLHSTKFQLLFGYLILLLCNFLLRDLYELHGHELPYYFDQLRLDYTQAKWYTFMLPTMAKAWGGTWSSLGIGLFPILKQMLGNTNAYLFLNLLFLSVVYWLSWFAFRSQVLTFTVGLCAAFTTSSNHVHENSSLIVIYVPLIFCFCNLFTVYQLFSKEKPNFSWWLLWGVSLLLYILSFEGWLDYYAVTLAVSPFCYYLLHKNKEWVRQRRLITLFCISSVLCFIYVLLKIKYGYASEKGAEHDLIFNYGLAYWPLMIEDVISNFFTFFYTTIITYIPPQFSFSEALLHYGPGKLIELQNGYDITNAYLATVNALLLWRFYAGVAITVFVYFLWRLVKSLLSNFNRDTFFLSLFMFVILIGAPAHLFVKFRPMHIIPWLAYQPFMGQVSLILLLAYVIRCLHQSATLSKKRIWLISLLIWSSIIACAFLKPPFYRMGVMYGGLVINHR